MLVDIAIESGFERAAFSACYTDPTTRLATGNDFMSTQSAGSRGFPALVVGDEQRGPVAVTVGYQRYPAIRDALAS